VARAPITKTDLFEDGLTGTADATVRRDALAAQFALPPGMTPNALLSALCVIATREEYKAAVERIQEDVIK
jgi:ribonuclease M5